MSVEELIVVFREVSVLSFSGKRFSIVKRFSKSITATLVIVGAFICLCTHASGQTVVATVYGTTPTLVASQATLAQAFVDELGNGSSIVVISVAVVYYSPNSSFYLKASGDSAGSKFEVATKLDISGSNALICQGSGGIVTVCQHPACNYAPCSLLPLCFGDCAGVGACVKVDNSLTSSGYLGTFH